MRKIFLALLTCGFQISLLSSVPYEKQESFNAFNLIQELGVTTANTALNGTLFSAPFTIQSYDFISENSGNVEVHPQGDFTYLPPKNFSGYDTFTYSLTDNKGSYLNALATITVLPTAKNSHASTFANIPLFAPSVLDNALGSNLQILSYDSSSIKGGSVTMDALGNYSYIPPQNFSSMDTFTYTIVDQAGNAISAKAKIAVKSKGPETILKTAFADTSLYSNTVLDQFVGSKLIISSFSKKSQEKGIVIMGNDGSFVYVPPKQFSGIDSFDFTVMDILGRKVASKVLITVLPSGPETLNVTTFKNNSIIFADLTKYYSGSGIKIAEVNPITAANGTIIFQENSFYKYSPAKNYEGEDHIFFSVVDSHNKTISAKITVNIIANQLENKINTSINTPFSSSIFHKNSPLEALEQFAKQLDGKELSSEKGGKITFDLNTATYTYIPPPGFVGHDVFEINLFDSFKNLVINPIKVEVSPISPPRHFAGKMFKSLKKYYLHTKWSPSPSKDIIAYNIYYKNQLLRRISSTEKRSLKIQLSRKKPLKNFSITSVNIFEGESPRRSAKG